MQGEHTADQRLYFSWTTSLLEVSHSYFVSRSVQSIFLPWTLPLLLSPLFCFVQAAPQALLPTQYIRWAPSITLPSWHNRKASSQWQDGLSLWLSNSPSLLCCRICCAETLLPFLSPIRNMLTSLHHNYHALNYLSPHPSSFLLLTPLLMPRPIN